MEKKQSAMAKAGRILLIILLILAAAAVVLGVVYRKAVKAVWANLTIKHFDLPDTDEWDGGTSYIKVPYASDSENQYLDLYVPDMEGEEAGKLPQLYVVIHGGGFITNDSQSRQARLMLRYFRDHGYACATINYRLAQEAPFPGALSDCKAAIRFLRAHAGEYGYNAEKIPVFGESAGGYLATMCTVTDDSEFTDVSFIDEEKYGKVSGKTDLLVDYYGHIENEGSAADWKVLGIPNLVYRIANSWVSGSNTQGYEDVESFWFRKNVSEMTPEEKAVYDPYTYMNSHDLTGLKAWIIHGDADITVAYLQSERLAAYLTEKLGAENVKYTLVPGMGHASDPLYSDEILAGLKEYMDKAL